MIARAVHEVDNSSPKFLLNTLSGGTENNLSNDGTENINEQTNPVKIAITKGS